MIGFALCLQGTANGEGIPGFHARKQVHSVKRGMISREACMRRVAMPSLRWERATAREVMCPCTSAAVVSSSLHIKTCSLATIGMDLVNTWLILISYCWWDIYICGCFGQSASMPVDRQMRVLIHVTNYIGIGAALCSGKGHTFWPTRSRQSCHCSPQPRAAAGATTGCGRSSTAQRKHPVMLQILRSRFSCSIGMTTQAI